MSLDSTRDPNRAIAVCFRTTGRRVHTQIHSCTNTCMYINMHAACVCVYAHKHVCGHIHTSIYTYLFMYIIKYMYIYLCIYISVWTDVDMRQMSFPHLFIHTHISDDIYPCEHVDHYLLAHLFTMPWLMPVLVVMWIRMSQTARRSGTAIPSACPVRRPKQPSRKTMRPSIEVTPGVLCPMCPCKGQEVRELVVRR